MAVREFKLPDPGEGLTEAEIVTWRVAVGDTVKVNDIVVEVETAKSLVELPIPYAGTVAAILAAEGEEVEVGTVIITVEDGVGGAAPALAEGPAATEFMPARAGASDTSAGDGDGDGEPETAEGLIGGTTSTGRTAVLVGYGIKQTEAKRRPRASSPPQAPPAVSAPAVAPAPVQRDPAAARVLAKPPVRKLAKDLGVDLATVTPTGPDGTISRGDVQGAAASAAATPSAATPSAAGDGARETRVPIKGVRKVTAQAMVGSAFTAPHVTEWVTVDVTATMDLVARLKKDREFADVKVTPLTILARAMCLAARRNPEINAAWDEAAQEIVVKHYVNLGIAAATPRGLIVPNVKDAGRMTLLELAGAIGALTATAREGRTQPAEQAGGTMTITNVGVFGVDAGTPILNPPEAAILAFGAVNRRPWVVTDAAGNESIVPRWVSTLALSFDHRLVDGELGSRFLADVAAIMADPARALVWG